MRFEYSALKVSDLVNGYDDGTSKTPRTAMGGRLVLRPSFQREFIYDDDKASAVIDSLVKGYSLGLVVFSELDGQTVVVDGQQRLTSICKYVCGLASFYGGTLFENLPEDARGRILSSEIPTATMRDASGDETIEQFRRTNTAGEPLTDMEILAAVYDCQFVQDLKRVFGPSFIQKGVGRKYAAFLKGNASRLSFMELAIRVFDPDTNDTEKILKGLVEGGKAVSDVVKRFDEVFSWFKRITSKLPEECRKYLPVNERVEAAYDRYHRISMGPEKFATLFKDAVDGLCESDNIRNLVDYVFTLDRQYITPRQFPGQVKIRKYKEQGGKCAACGNAFGFDEMEADHIRAWSLGGKSDISNCQMLCQECNKKKGNKEAQDEAR